ncbi:hypothetical protein LPJ60_003709 [Coemansia sp. RSA 2675]|nr:hypothetical protein LPJ60_003709 [Coemansia sp. RSA 2675]KAJ2411557.1 hypothetical protein GGI10_004197 [Coemansia sp. RSA 2530]
MTRIYLVAATLLALPAINAQFQFNPGTYDAAELYIQISGFYNSYASIWSTQLAQAKSSLPGAYSELTSIFNTDSIPESFDPEFVRVDAGILPDNGGNFNPGGHSHTYTDDHTYYLGLFSGTQ